MSVPAETIRTHLRYTAWASKLIVDAASTLTEEELTRDFKSADKSVLGTLVHVFAADRVWLGRIQGTPPAKFIDPETDMKLSVLENDWPKVLEGWQQWADSIDDFTRKFAYKDLAGNSYESPHWQVVLHVVNHGTHHRGQASAMIRSMGYTPPKLDLIFYYRSL
jgi:uncharacterized damage-inducible protein DinB